MNRKNLPFLMLLILFAIQSKAQVGLFKDQANFTNDVKVMMETSKLEPAITAGNNISSVYGASSDAVKLKLFDITKTMYQKKKFKAPQFTEFYSAIFAATSVKNISQTDLDSLLFVTQRVLDKYESKQITSFISTIRILFEKDALFSTTYNSLIVKGGSYKFRFVDGTSSSPVDKYEEALDQEKDQDEKLEDLDTDWAEDPTAVETTTQDETVEQTATEEAPIENVLDVGYLAPAQPTIEGAIIVFENIDLHIEAVNGNADLKGTNGSLLLKNNVFVGKGGKFDWSSAGVQEEISAELKEYNFPVTSTRIYSEGAVMTYPTKTDSSVEGIFEFKSVKHKNNQDLTYPRFKSFTSNIKMKGIGDNIEYHGGISLAGKKVYSSSVDEGAAMIKIKKGEDVIIESSATKFELGDSLILSPNATLVIYMNHGKDSIIHPGVAIKYNKNNAKIRAVKNSGFKHAPFIDSYHKLDMSVDGIEWHTNENKIDLSVFAGKSQINGVYESEKYYQGDKYSSIQGIYRFHPLQMLIGYAGKHKEIKDSTYNAQEIAKETKIDINSVRGSMVHLMKMGFIDYNVKSGIIKLRSKAKHYVLARRDKADYDNIILYSLVPGGPNSTLDLETNELVVRGVEKVFLSDSLAVFILPDSNTVRFQANRDFTFNGKINTENFQFVGTDFHFKYDSFLVHLRKIDEIKVSVTEKKDNAKDGKSRVLGNELKYSSGTLFINKPDNKSSRKKYAEYPIFDAQTGATVYFAKAHINGGAYDTTIQFKVPPFRVDSLSSDDSKAIGFDGEFKSGGIFPEFKEKLVVMPDYSLGFNHDVPKDGYQLYKNKGKFYNKITLDNQGIRGDGEIKYLTTTAWSKDFVFFKDSVITIGNKVETVEGKHPETTTQDVTFPDMQIAEYSMKWLPYQDSMILADIKQPFNLYKKTATLEGKSIITASGMMGDGNLFTRGSESQSPNYHFEQKEFIGRNSTFKILTEDPTKPALLCNDVKLDFDLEKREAIFSPEVEGYASNNFPYLQYKSSLDKGVWDLDKKKITMKMEEGGDINKSYFYSTHPNQDSLVYNATEGIYDMEHQVLNIHGVPYIKVADGKIFPDSNRVVVHENAVLETLKKAKIVIDTINEYHHLYDGTIDIRGRKKFSGEATYQYVNLGDDTLSFKFSDFRLQESLKKKDKSMSTVATGVVAEEDSLWIDAGVLYKGKVTMYADNKILFFDGYVQLVLNGALHYSQWMKYVNNGDRNDVVIDVNDPKADNGTPLFTGLHYNAQDSVKLYTSFISQKKNPNDFDIFTSKGLLNKDLQSSQFTVSPQEKIDKKTLVGNVFTYNDNTSKIEFSGKFNFTQTDPNFTVITTGNGFGDLLTSEYLFNTFQTFTCKGGSPAFDPIGKNLKLACSFLQGDSVVPSPEEYDLWKKKEQSLPYKLAEIVGDKTVQDYKTKSALGYVPLGSISSDFSKAIVLSDVDFKWNHEFNAWYSVGKIKVSNILKEDINKSINGYVEVRKGLKGDLINIYLEPTHGTWYYITYENNRLAAVTSNDEVNAHIAKKSKGELESRDKFFYVLGETMEKSQFKKFFEENYLGKVEEEITFDQHEQEKIEVPDAELEKQKEETPESTEEKEKKSPYPYEEKLEYEKKEGTKIEEPELNREKKEHTIEEQKQLQQDQQKLKSLFK